MKTYPVQNRFTAGELSPKLHSRSDIEGYAAGCKTLENFIALRHGSVERRDGTAIVATHAGYRGRIYEFQITETLAYAIVLSSDGNLYVDDRQGNMYGDNFGSNPDFSDGLTGWTGASTGKANFDWFAGRVLMQSGDTGATDTAILRQSVTITDDTVQHVIHIEAETLFGAAELAIKIGTTQGASDLLNDTMAVTEPDIYFDLPSAVSARLTSGGDTRVTSGGDTRVVTGQPCYIQSEVDGNGESEEGGWWLDRVSFHERTGTYTQTSFAHSWDVHNLEEMQVEMVPGENKMWLVAGDLIPYELDYNSGSWTFGAITFKGRPAAWNGYIDHDTDDGSTAMSEGEVVEILSGYAGGGTVGNIYRYLGKEVDLGAENYSSGWTDLGKVELYTGTVHWTTDDGTRRLSAGDVVQLVDGYAGGGTAGNVYQLPNTINLSSVNYATDTDWDDRGTKAAYQTDPNMPGSVAFFEGRSWFGAYPTTPDTLNGSRSANYTDLRLGSGADDDGIEVTLDDHGLIQWVRGEQDLLVGTKNGEYVLSAENGPLTPSDIQANKQSANGSAKMEARPIGNSVAYTSLDGSKIRDMEYKFVVNGWQSLDISYTAEHMFTDYGRVKEIHYAKDPESIIWMVTDQGNLIGCTFDPANDVIGWHRHPIDGKVISATVIRHKGRGELWLLVDRHCSGMPKTLMVERMTPNYYMDSAIGLKYQASTTAIDGFTHLANHTVNVIVDGAQADDVTLDANGDGTASISGNHIQVGYQYTSKLETLPTDVPVQGGSGMIHVKRWNKLWCRLYDSFVPLLNSQQVTETEPFSGDIDVVNLDWDLQATNIIQMSKPFKCKISGIFGELTEEIQ